MNLLLGSVLIASWMLAFAVWGTTRGYEATQPPCSHDLILMAISDFSWDLHE